MDVAKLVEGLTTLIPKGQRQALVASLKEDGDDGQWKDGAEALLTSALAKHYQKVGKDQYGRGQAELGNEYRTAIRTQFAKVFPGIDTVADEELIDHLGVQASALNDRVKSLSLREQESDNLPPEKIIEREDVRAHVAQMISAATADRDATIQSLTESRDRIIEQNKLSDRRAKLHKLIDAEVAAQKVILAPKGRSDMAQKALNALRAAPEFDPRRWIDKDGEMVMVDDKGNVRYSDITQSPVTFSEIFDQVNFLPKQVYPDNGDTPAPAGGSGSLSFRDSEEYMKARSAARNNPKKLRQVTEAWLSQQEATG